MPYPSTLFRMVNAHASIHIEYIHTENEEEDKKFGTMEQPARIS